MILAVAVTVAACGTVRLPPPDGAPAEVVARAYLEALVAGDCTATRGLLADGRRASHDLCGTGGVRAYRDLRGPAGTGDDVSFFVTLVLHGMPRTSGLDNGETGMFLNLVREPGGPWRVTGLGSGP